MAGYPGVHCVLRREHGSHHHFGHVCHGRAGKIRQNEWALNVALELLYWLALYSPPHPNVALFLCLQILSNTIQFTDIIGLLVMHMQYLVVVLRIQMSWPDEVVGLTRAASAVTNFADQAIKVASLGCLSTTGV